MVDVEIDNIVTMSARAQYHAGGWAYFFLQPNLSRVNLDGGKNLATRGLSGSDWEFGGDIGAG